MDNEVVIHVRADDETGRGYASAKAGANKTISDIEGEMKRRGPKIGDGLGGGIGGGLLSRMTKLGPEIGSETFRTTIKGLKENLPSLAQFGGVMGVVLAPTLGAAVAAGVLGGAGGLGVIGGLALAAKDPAVAAAGASMKATIGAALKDAAAPFVPVALESIGKVRSAFTKILPDIKSIFQDSSKFVAPLLDGIISGGTKIVSGIRNAVHGAQPVFEAFGRLFDNIGGAIGGIFDSLSDNGKDAASAVDDLGNSLTHVVQVTGSVINGLTELHGKLDTLDDKIDKGRYGLENWVKGLDLTADGYKVGSEAAELYRKGVIGASDSANNYTAYLKKQAETQATATDATNDQTSAIKELSDEMRAETDPLFALIKGQRDVTKAQERYNDALRKHGPRSAEAKDALNELGQAAFGLNSKVGSAAGGFNGKLTPAMRIALHNAGLTKGQMDRLEGSLRNAADAARDWEGTFRENFIVTKTVRTNNAGDQAQHGFKASGGIVGAAANGATSSGLTWTGEHGPELLDLPPGTRVHSNPDSQRMAAMGGGGGKLDITLRAPAGGSRDLMAVLLQAIRLEVRSQGGNVQQVLGVAGA